MVQWVHGAASAATSIKRVVVATDSDEILKTVRKFGGEACLTDREHPSGTDRMAEVARMLPDYGVLVNVQGDEPLMDPAMLDALVEGFLSQERAPVGTLVRKARNAREVKSPQTAKVARDAAGNALYFSRAPIPHIREARDRVVRWLHIGVYIYRREFLLEFSGWKPGPLERAESLEQLRVLENGHRIFTVETGAQIRGVDTPEDLESIRALVADKGLKPQCLE